MHGKHFFYGNMLGYFKSISEKIDWRYDDDIMDADRRIKACEKSEYEYVIMSHEEFSEIRKFYGTIAD